MNQPTETSHRNADSDRLTRLLIHAVAADQPADVAVLVRQACEEFETRTVILGLACITAALIEGYADHYPGGAPALLARVDHTLNHPGDHHG